MDGTSLEQAVGGQLPFMFKVLSAGKALSIQAHPCKLLARDLHRDNPKEYADDNHKPELAVALTPFRGGVGDDDTMTMTMVTETMIQVAANCALPPLDTQLFGLGGLAAALSPCHRRRRRRPVVLVRKTGSIAPSFPHLTINPRGLIILRYACDAVMCQSAAQGSGANVSGGLGGAFGYFYGVGRPLPIPECQPYRPSFRFRMLGYLGSKCRSSTRLETLAGSTDLTLS